MSNRCEVSHERVLKGKWWEINNKIKKFKSIQKEKKTMAVRIQLASNFQVVELTYDSWKDVDYQEVADATTMVNRLGSEVVNEIKTNKHNNEKKDEEMATEGQISFLKKLGVSESKAKSMTKKEAWKYIQDNK